MPTIGDIISTLIIQEVDGVQVANLQYWQVDDLGTDPSLLVGLQDVLDHYYTSVNAFLGTAWKLVCGTYENITATEAKTVIFDTRAGTGVGDVHPQDQVLRVNEYHIPSPAATVRRNAWNQSGLIESLSTDGRVNNLSTVAPLATFLTSQIDLGPGRWLLDPQCRFRLTVGPPPTFGFGNTDASEIVSRLFKLGKRKPKLCAVT